MNPTPWKILKFAKYRVRRLVQRRLRHSSPRGIDLGTDLRRSLPGYRPSVVFDVGANVGQSTLIFQQWFPEAHIHAFEPVAASFQKLLQRLHGSAYVHCVQAAVGDHRGQAVMRAKGTSTMNSLVQNREVDCEDVQLITITGYCRDQSINQIGFMKIDTEGHDLHVLKGAETLLVSGSIDVIQAETGMNPENRDHVPFEDVKQYLESFGYRLFGIYEQVGEWPLKQPHLRRTNPVFLAPRMIAFRGEMFDATRA